ncbi:MAG: 4-hydroxybenzoate octaprenyltransferase [Halieaceae bacterium]|jgi:4-hydroxybenzoate polyprenyltransferase|nr:4-hydroxybenzoate octaprenyltransferase [Halieaceae bacterium]
MSTATSRFSAYLQLVRFDRPIGTLLLLWPTLWALWLAAGGVPPLKLLVIFSLGTLLMRSAGCAVNDLADRNLDGAVERTRERPLVTGAVAPNEALVLAATLSLAAFVLVLFTNTLTILLSFAGVLLAACYPFMKRHTHLPQLVLGAAFSWGIPMAFAAVSNALPPALWLVFVANLFWTVAYDTEYAMVDREDDLKVGIKSTAILFGEMDRHVIAALQALTIIALLLVGQRFELGWIYFLSLLAASLLFVYQQRLIREREPADCFRAFLNNNWVGAAVFAGVVLDAWSRGTAQ